VGKTYILGANIIAATTSDTHLIAETLFKVYNLMEHLKAHPLTVSVAVAATACYICELVNHA
jgi:hypothetical protein